MEKRFQARFNDTGEPVGVPQAKATEAVKILKQSGFSLARSSVEMWVKMDGTWTKDVTCPALAVR